MDAKLTFHPNPTAHMVPSKRRSSSPDLLQQQFHYAKLARSNQQTPSEAGSQAEGELRRNSRADECFTVGGCLKSSLFLRSHRIRTEKRENGQLMFIMTTSHTRYTRTHPVVSRQRRNGFDTKMDVGNCRRWVQSGSRDKRG